MSLSLRKARADDFAAIEGLIGRSVRGLSVGYYSSEQVEAALGNAFGLDRQLISDQTYFVAERDGRLAGCGGWSRRRTLFGADAATVREPELLDPATEAARIRAFFVEPDFARQGVGRALYEACAAEAAEEGFTALELMATLPGLRLYEVLGFVAGAPQAIDLGGGVSITFVPMRLTLEGRRD